MRFFVSADETGNLKEVVCTRGTDTSKKDGQQPELVQNLLQKSDVTRVRNRILQLQPFQEKWLLGSRLGGYLSVHEFFGSSTIPEENYLHLHTYKLDVEDSDRPVSLVSLGEHDFAIVAFESGKIFIVYFNEGKFDVEPLKIELPPRQKKKPCTVNAFACNPYNPGIFASGGKDNDVQIFRLFENSKIFTKEDFQSIDSWTIKTLFKADNVGPDHLGLDVPIWISQILFMKSESTNKFKLVTATRHGHIRKYDTAVDKEPTESYTVCEKPIVTLNFATEAQDEIIISDTHTFVARVSLTQIEKKAHRIVSASAGTFYKPGLKLLGKYSEGGNTGAVHGVDLSVKKGVVVFGGLDRYLRVFEIQSRKLISKVYLGTQISTITMLDDSDKDDSENRDAEEDEEFWDELDAGKETQNGAPVLKKRKRNI